MLRSSLEVIDKSGALRVAKYKVLIRWPVWCWCPSRWGAIWLSFRFEWEPYTMSCCDIRFETNMIMIAGYDAYSYEISWGTWRIGVENTHRYLYHNQLPNVAKAQCNCVLCIASRCSFFLERRCKETGKINSLQKYGYVIVGEAL